MKCPEKTGKRSSIYSIVVFGSPIDNDCDKTSDVKEMRCHIFAATSRQSLESLTRTRECCD